MTVLIQDPSPLLKRLRSYRNLSIPHPPRKSIPFSANPFFSVSAYTFSAHFNLFSFFFVQVNNKRSVFFSDSVPFYLLFPIDFASLTR